MDMSGNRAFEDGDNHDVNEPIFDDGNFEAVELGVFGIRNALEQPNVRVYTALDLHSKPRDSDTLQPIIFLVLIHHAKIELYQPYQRGEHFAVSSSIALKLTKGQALSGLRKSRWESLIRSSTTSTSPRSSLQ